jgi:Zn-dependent peptidase ImmA (M78 family)/DNA-binding XRE family transcriptional regulator
MPVEKHELARRLRAAREACHFKQEDVAGRLGVSRSTIAQMELGNWAVTSLELDKLAHLYGRDLREFLAEAFHEEDALVALFRRHPEVSEQEDVMGALRGCVALRRELTNLERLLGIDRDAATAAAYPLPAPRTKWDAVQQGERIAGEERRRIGLGTVPLPDVAELLDAQGVRTAQIALPEDVSGLTLIEPDIGLFVVANNRQPGHSYVRRRFSYAHEYCHVLLEREQKGTISRASDRDSLLEVRANSFAASLLMPAEGVKEFVKGLAKGRLQAEVFDEEEALPAQARPAPGSQAIQMYDLVLLAHHFGVSRISALYRLKNLKLVSELEFDTLKAQEEGGRGRSMATVLGLPEPDREEARNEFRHRFLALGLEVFRRGEITRRKLGDLGAMVGVGDNDLTRTLDDTGIEENEEGSDVLVPKV